MFYFKRIYKFDTDYFFTGAISFLLFIKNVFIKIKNSISLPKYSKYGKNVKQQNVLFQKDIQICY